MLHDVESETKTFTLTSETNKTDGCEVQWDVHCINYLAKLAFRKQSAVNSTQNALSIKLQQRIERRSQQITLLVLMRQLNAV